MKLETSNLAHRWMAMSTNEKNAKLRQNGSRGVTTFGIMGPPNISERMKLESSNLAHRWTAVSNNEKCKIRSKGVMWGSRDPLLEFWDFMLKFIF